MVSPHPESSSALLYFLRFALPPRSHTGPLVGRKSFATLPRWTKVDRITGTCCAGSSSRLTGKRRFRRWYKTHGASARFLRPGSAAFYTGNTFPERRSKRNRKPRDIGTLASGVRFSSRRTFGTAENKADLLTQSPHYHRRV